MPLEGASEMLYISKAFEHLGIDVHKAHIELFDMGGNSNDYGLLARYVAVPDLGKELQGDLVLLNRPVTRVLIVSDPENRLATKSGRDTHRQQILGSIFRSLPPKYQTELVRSQMESYVAVETWTENDSFEFAHFRDGEIATAIRAVVRSKGVIKPKCTAREVALVRRSRGNLKTLLRAHRKASKKELAEQLWPVLRRKIDRHIRADSLDELPIGRLLKLSLELSAKSFRRNIGLQVSDR
jgi:hypothetical protein